MTETIASTAKVCPLTNKPCVCTMERSGHWCWQSNEKYFGDAATKWLDEYLGNRWTPDMFDSLVSLLENEKYPSHTCRLCLTPCAYLFRDIKTNTWLPGYCDNHGADMLKPLTTPVAGREIAVTPKEIAPINEQRTTKKVLAVNDAQATNLAEPEGGSNLNDLQEVVANVARFARMGASENDIRARLVRLIDPFFSRATEAEGLLRRLYDALIAWNSAGDNSKTRELILATTVTEQFLSGTRSETALPAIESIINEHYEALQAPNGSSSGSKYEELLYALKAALNEKGKITK